jgi:hypothetical protein
MGQYEPNDSRNVTLKPGREPGGIERTGPREDEARREAGQSKSQSQSQSGQSQSQSSRQQQQEQERQDDGGNSRSALDDPAGDPRPEYDQYAVNQPDTVNRPGVSERREARAAYGNSRDEDGRMEDPRAEQPSDPDRAERQQQAERQGGGTVDGDGFVGETSPDPSRRARADAERQL